MLQDSKNFQVVGSGRGRYILIISLIVIVFYMVSSFFKDAWFRAILRPYDPENYLTIYFLTLWLFGVIYAKNLLEIDRWKRILLVFVVMHFISLFIITYVLGFIHFDNNIERITNSWNLSGGFSYFSVTLIVGSAKCFMLGGGLYGAVGIILLGCLDSQKKW